MSGETQSFDAVVIGAGFSGMHMLKSLRDKLGLKVRVYEAGGTVGGTWYWNHLGQAVVARVRMVRTLPEQPEILRYLEHVAQCHDLKRDMQFNTRVTSAVFDESADLWRVSVANALISSRRSRRIGSPTRVADNPMPKRKSLVSRNCGSIVQRLA